MNKKLNTLLFVLCATLFNILIALISFLLLSVLYANTLAPMLSEENHRWVFSLIFVACLAVSFFVYRAIMKYLLNKIDVEKYFDPIFVRKNFKKK